MHSHEYVTKSQTTMYACRYKTNKKSQLWCVVIRQGDEIPRDSLCTVTNLTYTLQQANNIFIHEGE